MLLIRWGASLAWFRWFSLFSVVYFNILYTLWCLVGFSWSASLMRGLSAFSLGMVFSTNRNKFFPVIIRLLIQALCWNNNLRCLRLSSRCLDKTTRDLIDSLGVDWGNWSISCQRLLIKLLSDNHMLRKYMHFWETS